MAATAGQAPATGTVCLQPRPFIQAGDLVIIYESHDNLDHLYLSAEYGKMYNNRYAHRVLSLAS